MSKKPIKKVKVEASKPQVKAEKVTVAPLSVSAPESDFNHKTIPVNFQRRAGLKNHGQEMAERLKDLEDDGNSDVYYLLPVKLPKKVYAILLKQAIDLAKEIPDWNERDMLEVLVIFSNIQSGLTLKKGQS